MGVKTWVKVLELIKVKLYNNLIPLLYRIAWAFLANLLLTKSTEKMF